MFWKINYNLWRLRRKARPSKEFRAALWYKLSERLETTVVKSSFKSLWFQPVFQYAVAPICLVLLFGLGTGAYAYSSATVNEASPLYGLKKGLEKMEEQLARSPEKRAIFQIKKMQRRAAELETLQAKNLPYDATLADFNQAAESGLAAVEDVTLTDLQGMMIKRITEQGINQLNQLEQAKANLPLPAQPKMETVIKKQVEHLEQRFEKLRENQDKSLEKQLLKFERIQDEIAKQGEKINQLQEQLEQNNLLINPFPEKKQGRTEEKNKNK